MGHLETEGWTAKARDAFGDGMTPEGRVKEKVKALLRRYGAYYFMPVQYGYGAPSVDFLVCHQGFFAAIETKAEGKKPTKRQALVLQEIAEKGGATFVIEGVDTFMFDRLEKWLANPWWYKEHTADRGHS